MTTVRTGTVHDLPGAYRVCLLTGRSGADATPLHGDPDLLGHVWVGPYFLFPDAVTRVVQDELGVAGYCVAVPDTTAFDEWLEHEWLPPLRDRYPSGSGSTDADRSLVDHLHRRPHSDAGLLAGHPAHLHIDLLPRLQGQGWGRRIMAEVLDALARAGARGVHLGVDESNTGAQMFYERLGFSVLTEAPGARFYGIRLSPPTG